MNLKRVNENAVPMRFWSKDHWSTFAYLCCRVTGNDGYPDKDHMRVDRDRHPGLIGPRVAMLGTTLEKYPTRLQHGILLEDHDDFDCVDDFEAEDLVTTSGTGIAPRWHLTEAGWKVNKLLTEFKEKGGQFGEFKMDPTK